jgi:hypothetical protein
MAFRAAKARYLPAAARAAVGIRMIVDAKGVSSSLNHPCHIPTADRAQAHQQQVAAFDCPCEVGNGGFILAFAAPDVGEQQFPCLRWNSGPQLGSSGSELRDLLDVHNV